MNSFAIGFEALKKVHGSNQIRSYPGPRIHLRFTESIVSQSQSRQVAECIFSIAFHIPLIKDLSPRLENGEHLFDEAVIQYLCAPVA